MDTSYSPLEFALLNDWQRNFPVLGRPYQAIAQQLSANGYPVAEAGVLEALSRLADRGAISRVGAVFAPRWVGASTLAAVAAPTDRLEAIAECISAHPEVNHNYLREHAFNVWFVVAAPDSGRLREVLRAIEMQTGCKVLAMPLEREFHIDLGFDLRTPAKSDVAHANVSLSPPTRDERRLIGALQAGLALVPRPFAQLAERVSQCESWVVEQIKSWLVDGRVKRFGVIVRHHELGYRNNAMVVFDVPDTTVDSVGALLAQVPGVTLCYRRRRCLPEWRYNLYCMVHGRSREQVLPVIARLRDLAGCEGLPLFSTRRFKQTGARYVEPVVGLQHA